MIFNNRRIRNMVDFAQHFSIVEAWNKLDLRAELKLFLGTITANDFGDADADTAFKMEVIARFIEGGPDGDITRFIKETRGDDSSISARVDAISIIKTDAGNRDLLITLYVLADKAIDEFEMDTLLEIFNEKPLTPRGGVVEATPIKQGDMPDGYRVPLFEGGEGRVRLKRVDNETVFPRTVSIMRGDETLIRYMLAPRKTLFFRTVDGHFAGRVRSLSIGCDACAYYSHKSGFTEIHSTEGVCARTSRYDMIASSIYRNGTALGFSLERNPHTNSNIVALLGSTPPFRNAFAVAVGQCGSQYAIALDDGSVLTNVPGAEPMRGLTDVAVTTNHAAGVTMKRTLIYSSVTPPPPGSMLRRVDGEETLYTLPVRSVVTAAIYGNRLVVMTSKGRVYTGENAVSPLCENALDIAICGEGIFVLNRQGNLVRYENGYGQNVAPFEGITINEFAVSQAGIICRSSDDEILLHRFGGSGGVVVVSEKEA